MNNIKEDEGGIANVTGDSPAMAMPPTMKRKYKLFDVDSKLFRRFETGKIKFEHWSKYLDMTNEDHRLIYEYARSNRRSAIILKNSENSALRIIRRS